MTYSHHGWPPSQPPSQPHGLETESRLTKLEVNSESHSARITMLERVMYGLIIGLSGMAHEKLPRVVEWIETIAKLRP